MAVAACLAWAFVLSLILRQRMFVTNDSLSNYAHVWYISDQLWEHTRVPLHMPVIGHGKAFAFPYSLVPWLGAAVLRPIFGDWIVTLWLVVGFLAAVAGMFWAFPEVRRGWWAAILLVDPFLVASPLLGQLPFLWATAFLFVAIGCWRRGWYWQAALLAALAQGTHPAVVLPITGSLVIGWVWFEPRRRQLLGWYACSVFLAAPAIWFVLASPVVSTSSRMTLIVNFVGTVAPRAVVVFLPIALIVLQRWRPRLTWAPAAVFELLLVLNAGMVPMLHTHPAWLAVRQRPDTLLVSFYQSPAFQRGSTYRLLRAYDAKVDMYQLIQYGGRLDSEFFPESIDRRSWPSLPAYVRFLNKRRIDHVIIFANYDQRYRTNEHQLLNDLTDPTRRGDSPVCAVRTVHNRDYDVYAIERSGCN